MITFDHIAIAASTLAEGNAYFHDATGTKMPEGGEHPLMGTHNCLTALGPDTFAEIIAINPDAPKPAHPRWFDLDNITKPKIAWLLRTDDIDGCIERAAAINIDLGRALPQVRGDLRWRFSVRDDGTIPLDGAAPLILQWDTDGPHPAGRMTDLGQRMDGITIHTPHDTELHQLLDTLGLTDKPDIVKSDTHEISVTLRDANKKEMTLA